MLMYHVIEFEDSVRVPPLNIAADVNESVRRSLADKYEGKVIRNLGVVLVITDVKDVGEGMLVEEDAGVHYHTRFESLVYVPKLHEIIRGYVVDITNFGVFVRFGPLDGLCHISQVVNDYVSFDSKTSVLSARDSKKVLKVGDEVQARIIAVSLEKKEVNKINLTMRQPGLGSLQWLEDEKKEKAKAAAKAAKAGK